MIKTIGFRFSIHAWPDAPLLPEISVGETADEDMILLRVATDAADPDAPEIFAEDVTMTLRTLADAIEEEPRILLDQRQAVEVIRRNALRRSNISLLRV